MDKSFSEWQRRLKGMQPEKITDAWAAKADSDLSWLHEPAFHAAAADRMKQLGNMAIDLDDETRKKLCHKATNIVDRLQKSLAEEVETWDSLQKQIEARDEYFRKFGTRTARYYMYEQGVIDLLGDRKAG